MAAGETGAESDAWRRFMASTDIDYERWHDGVPYDLDALQELRGAERERAEAWLLARAASDWRDLEGLLALGTSGSRAAVVEQLRRGKLEQRLSAARRLDADPSLAGDREAAVVEGLRLATFGAGLSDAFDIAIREPTPAIRDALLRAALRRETSVHAAAALEFLHGLASEAFDWDRRPFYLRFNDDDEAVRTAAFRELCRELDVDPARYL